MEARISQIFGVRNILRIVRFEAALILIILIASPYAVAQSTTTNIYKKSPGYELWQKQHQASEESGPLPTFPNLPDVPQYPRKTQYLGGRAFPKAGPSYYFRFIAMEESKPILDWYKNALSSAGWRIGNENSSTVVASLDSTGSNIVVSLRPETHGGGRSAVSIHYTTGRIVH